MRGVSEIYDSSRIFRKIEKALIFGFSRDLPLEGEKIIFPFRQKSQQRILRKKIPKQVQLLISLSENKWEEKNNFIQPAILGISRCLPFEEKFFSEGG